MKFHLFQKSFLFVALTVTALTVPGCKGDDDQPSESDQGTDSVDLLISESELTAPLVEGTDSPVGLNSDQLLNNAKNNAPLFYPDCADLVVSLDLTAKKITYTFANCTGPWKRRYVSGSVEITVTSIVDNTISYAAKGTALNVVYEAGSAVFDFESTGSITFENGKKTISAMSTATGTTARNVSVSRTGNFSASWDPATRCASISGTWNLMANSQTWTTIVQDYEKCDANCPKAGGSVTFTGTTGNLLVVSYDGSDVATWQTLSTKGATREGTVTLLCMPN